MDIYQEALRLHANHQGKIEVRGKVSVGNSVDLSLAYSPGVAEPCREIAKNADNVYKYTAKGNLVAVVSDGTAVLGLGDIGPLAALPVMEGKVLLFKKFAGIDAFPICLDTKSVDDIIAHVKAIAPSFGGINLEDISGPRCFEIEQRLREVLDIPVFHDDQHGTAVVVFAGLLNALRLVDKKLSDVKIIIQGAGAAGVAITRLLLQAGVKNITVTDIGGVIHPDRSDLSPVLKQLAVQINKSGKMAAVNELLVDADVFIGVSAGNTITRDMISVMAEKAIVFALANPTPEIMPEDAKAAGAFIVATGRSDVSNQINNVLGFPGIFRGALDIRAKQITENMKLAAANAIAGLVSDDDLAPDYIIPSPFDPRVAPEVAAAVAKAGMADHVARVEVDPRVVAQHCRNLTAKESD